MTFEDQEKASKKAQEKFQESISSFVDDELDANNRDELDKLILQLEENEEQKQVWGRYCVMRDAMKKTLPETVNHNLLKRVQLALEAEPALVMPDKAAEAEIVVLPNLDSFKAESSKKVVNDTVFKPAFSFAIAATVTIAAVLGFQMFTQTDDLPQQAVVASNNEPATQQIQIASHPASKLVVPSTAVSLVVNELKARSENVTYAEQSLMDDGRWTRLTQVDGVPLATHLLSGGAEAQVRFKLQNGNSPLARPVNLENTVTK